MAVSDYKDALKEPLGLSGSAFGSTQAFQSIVRLSTHAKVGQRGELTIGLTVWLAHRKPQAESISPIEHSAIVVQLTS